MGASGCVEADQFLPAEIWDLLVLPRTPSFVFLGFLPGENFWSRGEREPSHAWILATAVSGQVRTNFWTHELRRTLRSKLSHSFDTQEPCNQMENYSLAHL